MLLSSTLLFAALALSGLTDVVNSAERGSYKVYERCNFDVYGPGAGGGTTIDLCSRLCMKEYVGRCGGDDDCWCCKTSDSTIPASCTSNDPNPAIDQFLTNPCYKPMIEVFPASCDPAS